MKQALLFLAFIFLAGTASYAQQGAYAQSKSQKPEQQLIVYPNPATQFIGVNGNKSEVKQIIVYNLVGRRMKSFDRSQSGQYYVADLPIGMYLVQLLGRNNEVLRTQRLSKR